MRVLCVCVTLVAVIPRCILAQPVSGSGSVTAKAGDAWLDDGFNSGDAGRGHGRGALDGAEEESTDLDRIMDEHIADLEEKPKTIKDLMKVLLDVDFTVHPTLENLVETFKTNVDIALKKLPSAVELAKASVAEDRLSRKKKELASSMGAETNIKTRALRSSAAAKKPEADTVETSDNGSETVPNADGQDDDDAYDGDIGSDDDDSFDDYETTNDYSADDSADNLQNYTGNAYSSFTSSNSTRKKTAGGRGRGRSRSHDPFGSHTSPNHHRQKFFKKIQQGIYDGNHDHLMGFLGGAQAHATRAHREFMDIQHNSRRRLSEDEELMGRQCMLLAKCTKSMSLYDTMVYFYSDDLDPSTGELDDSIIHFDEIDLRNKHKKARALAKRLYGSHRNDPASYATESSSCDALLQLFHRNIEHAGVPHWQGATVSQVCLAEGTQEFIGLEQIATKVSLETADYVAKEMYQCAQSLYNSGARSRSAGEQFVFSAKNSRKHRITLASATTSSSASSSYPVKNLIDNNKFTSYRAARNAKKVTIFLVGKWNIKYQIQEISFTWRVPPKHYQYYVSSDGVAWTKLYDSITKEGGVEVNDGETVGRLYDVTKTVKLEPSETLGHRVKVVCTGGASWGEYITGKRVVVKATVPTSESTKSFEDDFVVPKGLNLGGGVRDKHGHAGNPSVPLYAYDEPLVYQRFVGLRQIAGKIYKRVFERYIQSDYDLRNLYKFDFNEGSNSYSKARLYLLLVKKAMDSNTLADFVERAVEHFQPEIQEFYGWARHKDAMDDLQDYGKLIGLFEDEYKKVQHGFNMVFGDKASVGFLCGIKEVVAEKGPKKFPGTCCLDTPYEGTGDNWGREHSCSATCKHPGPFFGGLNEHACETQGGTWCPAPADCTELKQCVDDQIELAKANGKLAYEKYLEPAIITDPLDFEECGRSRKYFGYDELYTHDEDICDNFQQLHNTKDFGFLDEFFDQGTPDSGGGGGGGDEEVPALVPLKEPDHSGSEETAKKENKYKITLFVFQQVFAVLEVIKDVIAGIKCPDDLSGAVQSGCAAVSNLAMAIAAAVVAVLGIVHDILYFIFDTLIGPSDASRVEAYENTAPVFENLELMYQRMYEAEVRQQEKTDSLQEKMIAMEEKLTSIFEATVSESERKRNLLELDSTENQALAG